MFEERRFRPFDVDKRVERFLRETRLVVAGNADVFIELNQTRTVTESDLISGHFAVEFARDEASFVEIHDDLKAGISAWEDSKEIGLIVVASSGYLKLAHVLCLVPVDELTRQVELRGETVAEPFQATYHGCDIDVSLVLLNECVPRPLEPWRKGTWLTRGKFGLRTSIDGFGYVILPLTDEVREGLKLPATCLRYIDIPLSPLDMTTAVGTNVDVYVDADLLARIEKESSRPWAVAFTDQLALDFLTAIVLRAVSTPDLKTVEWDEVSGTLLGSVIELVAKTSDAATLQQYLEELRDEPNRFIANIEGALDMRANAKRLQVN